MAIANCSQARSFSPTHAAIIAKYFTIAIYNSSATVTIRGTILNAGYLGANLYSASGSVSSLGYNLSNDNGGGFLTANGDQINTDPMLGPLQDNGGPTFTHELLAGSPDIDAGDPSFTPPPDYDQRGPGYNRIANGWRLAHSKCSQLHLVMPHRFNRQLTLTGQAPLTSRAGLSR